MRELLWYHPVGFTAEPATSTKKVNAPVVLTTTMLLGAKFVYAQKHKIFQRVLTALTSKTYTTVKSSIISFLNSSTIFLNQTEEPHYRGLLKLASLHMLKKWKRIKHRSLSGNKDF
jgi:hypothetical protein